MHSRPLEPASDSQRSPPQSTRAARSLLAAMCPESTLPLRNRIKPVRFDWQVKPAYARSNSVIAMQRPSEQIKCPRNPSHGTAIKRWLRGEYQERGGSRSARIADIFEIDCGCCGKFEVREERSVDDQFPKKHLPQ